MKLRDLTPKGDTATRFFHTRRAFPASLILHALLLLAFLCFSKARKPTEAPNEGIPVEIWTPEQLKELTDQEDVKKADAIPAPALSLDDVVHNADTTPSPDPAPKPVEATPVDRSLDNPGMIRAPKILSATVLAHPRSKDMREALPLFEEETRLEQICDLEAMAHIAAAMRPFRPDRVVAYAMADLKVDQAVVTAEGAAFRSNGKWYNLKFKCELTADRQTVRSFEFGVGKPIPKRLWEQHNLPAVY